MSVCLCVCVCVGESPDAPVFDPNNQYLSMPSTVCSTECQNCLSEKTGITCSHTGGLCSGLSVFVCVCSFVYVCVCLFVCFSVY